MLMPENRRKWLLDFLRGRSVDRVPVIPFINDNFIQEFFHSQDVDPVEKGIEIYEYFGFDIILRPCNVWSYLSEAQCDAKNWRVSEFREDYQNGWMVSTVIKTPEKELVQRKKFNRATENEVVEAVVEYYIKSEDDFEQFLKYQPPVPEYDCSIIGKARELLEDKGLAAPWVQGAFNSVSFYRKVDDLIVDPYVNPDFYGRMLTYFSNRMLNVVRQFAKAGADIVCCSGNVGNGTMAGPNFFKEFILPYEIDFFSKVRETGLFSLYHNCGDASSLLDLYSQIKMEIYESLTAPPYGDTILENALEKIDRNIILSGNIDQISFLRTATPEEIKKEVERVLRLAKKRGNFILGTTDYLSEGTPYKNIMALAETGREFGRY